MKGVATLFREMTKEEKELAKGRDFNTMMNEMDDHMNKWIGMIDTQFGPMATDKQIFLIDATMIAMYIAMQDGDVLIKKAAKKGK
jgi:hypothetical protein